MTDHADFLIEKARQLRALAVTAPEIGEQLRGLAEELEQVAADLARPGRRPREAVPPRPPPQS